VLLAADENLDHDAWLEAMVNNIAGRPATGWRDEDAERFKAELRVIGGAFHRYQALHFETVANDTTEGFEPHRVTITSPGGNEYNDVVWVDQTAKPRLQDIVDSAIAASEAILGSRGGEAVMAVLAGTVIGAQQDLARAIEAPASQRKVLHA